jgi:hypothetical protein
MQRIHSELMDSEAKTYGINNFDLLGSELYFPVRLSSCFLPYGFRF